MIDRYLNNLGLCQRASGLITGEEQVVNGLRSGQVHLVFLASDVGKNTGKKIMDKAKFYGVEVISEYTSDELSQAIGKTNRMVIGITKRSFLKILKK